MANRQAVYVLPLGCLPRFTTVEGDVKSFGTLQRRPHESMRVYSEKFLPGGGVRERWAGVFVMSCPVL